MKAYDNDGLDAVLCK